MKILDHSTRRRRAARTWVSALLVALTALTLAGPSATAATRYTSHVSFNASPEPLVAGQKLSMSGRLTYDRGGRTLALKGKQVGIYFDPAGSEGAYRVAVTKTNSDGRFSYAHRPGRSGTWIAHYGGQSNVAAVRALDYVAVRYTSHVSFNASPEPLVAGQKLSMSGRLTYDRGGRTLALKGKQVGIYFDPAGSDGAYRVAVTKTNSDGRFSYAHRPGRSGTWIAHYGGQSNVAAVRALDYVEVGTAHETGPWSVPGPDLDCSDIRKKVWVGAHDYHRLDADGDGWGCESYS